MKPAKDAELELLEGAIEVAAADLDPADDGSRDLFAAALKAGNEAEQTIRDALEGIVSVASATEPSPAERLESIQTRALALLAWLDE